ncbi:hypothetical protein WS84_28230 [Burkholderia anthina]|uniref:hypothetical protein n=1 Tax=Burkholderia TaxID=32008 RepID=UPI000751BF18|nr:hypothetical protein [Burkholderia anthina]KVH05423.1 hypothetical protein WS84_28230 [Burkholderia anthina]
MAKKVGTYDIPFDNVGNQLDYPGHASEMKANHEFEDTLTYHSCGRGRSSVGFTFKRSDGRKVNVFLTDMDDWIPQLNGGKISGRFTFVKRGQNYGCTKLG